MITVAPQRLSLSSQHRGTSLMTGRLKHINPHICLSCQADLILTPDCVKL